MNTDVNTVCFVSCGTAAVSFTIKTKDEEAPVLKKAAALHYESSDEDGDDADDDDDNDNGRISAVLVMLVL